MSLMRAADQTDPAAKSLAALASALPHRLDQTQHARGASEIRDPGALANGKPVSWIDAHRGVVVAGVLAFFALAVFAIINSPPKFSIDLYERKFGYERRPGPADQKAKAREHQHREPLMVERGLRKRDGRELRYQQQQSGSDQGRSGYMCPCGR
jgi:hypothetical protein